MYPLGYITETRKALIAPFFVPEIRSMAEVLSPKIPLHRASIHKRAGRRGICDEDLVQSILLHTTVALICRPSRYVMETAQVRPRRHDARR